MDDLNLYLAAGQGLHPVADWAVDFMLTCGPGIALCGAIYGLLCTAEAVRDRRARRRQIRHQLQQIRQATHDLNTCNAIWNATNAREEKP